MKLVTGMLLSCTLFVSSAFAAEKKNPAAQAPDAVFGVAATFGDHMVLQQGKPVQVWGHSAPGATVTVQFDGQSVQGTADGSGMWKLQLAPMKAKPTAEQTPQVMTISDGKETRQITDVLIGEVWLGSGQSNMNREIPAAKAAAMQPTPGLRIRMEIGTPWKSLDTDPREAAGFSSMMLPFGKRLVEELKVPVGVIVGAAGGTDSGRWLAKGAGADPELLRVAALYEKRYPEFQKQYEKDKVDLEAEDAQWQAALLPFLKKHWNYLTTENARNKNSAIQTFIAGGGDLSKVQRLGDLSKDQLKLLDEALTPLIKNNGPEGQEGLALVDDFVRARYPERLDLRPFWLSWHYGWGVRLPLPLEPAKPPAPKRPTEAPGDLFARHIAPFVPFAIRGIVWDQGESGSGIPGVDQFTLMSALIKSWRAQWGDELPWIYIQKPSGEGCRLVYEKKDVCVPFQAKLPEFMPDPNWGLYREIHVRIRTLPKTFMVASSDLGPEVHPQDKDRYGRRAGDVALNVVYGKPIQCFGPIYQSYRVEGDTMRITFRETGSGLVAAHAENPQGFEIAGADQKFYWADAKIVSPDTVELSCDRVKTPVAARYAYSCYIPWANLFNKEGLPAATFRTDDWTWEGQNPIFVWKMFFTASRRMNWVWDPAPASRSQ